MANHRKTTDGARRSHNAALANRLALHRATRPTVAGAGALATLEPPRPEPAAASASVPKGQSSETVTVSGMTSDSLVLVTLQSARSGVHVLGAVPAHGEFTVHLSKKAPRATRFAWYVVN
jgi:hypothetical protein